jgi:hypothetical protein
VRRPNATSFKPGQSGNPKGKPKGAKDRLPRGMMRQLYAAAIEKKHAKVVKLIEGYVVSEKYGLQAHELAGKLFKEIGPADAATAMKPTVIIIKTNVNMLALAGKNSSMLAARPTNVDPMALASKKPPALPAKVEPGYRPD